MVYCYKNDDIFDCGSIVWLVYMGSKTVARCISKYINTGTHFSQYYILMVIATGYYAFIGERFAFSIDIPQIYFHLSSCNKHKSMNGWHNIVHYTLLRSENVIHFLCNVIEALQIFRHRILTCGISFTFYVSPPISGFVNLL